VDDDRALLKSLKNILKSKGYSVDTAETGREAIEKSEAKFFHLALLDIALPDMEGTKLLTQMHKTTPKMMKIMITGYPSLENAVEAVNLGADAYIIKPINAEKLLKVVGEKLREQEAAEKLTQEKVAEWIETRVRKLERERKTS
jgi:DNA-binding NtrC family response regulator